MIQTHPISIYTNEIIDSIKANLQKWLAINPEPTMFVFAPASQRNISLLSVCPMRIAFVSCSVS
jgi:hypothetical protein